MNGVSVKYPPDIIQAEAESTIKWIKYLKLYFSTEVKPKL